MDRAQVVAKLQQILANQASPQSDEFIAMPRWFFEAVLAALLAEQTTVKADPAKALLQAESEKPR